MARKNKKLLSEGQVRQFMKLANLAPLTPGFVYGLHERDSADDSDLPGLVKIMDQGTKDKWRRDEKNRVRGKENRADLASDEEAWKKEASVKRDAGPPSPERAVAGKRSAAKEIDMPAQHVPAQPDPRALRKSREKKAAAAGDPTARRNPKRQQQQESHGRGQDEGSGGYGHPDPRQRPAGSRLREQDEDMELDVELDDLEGDELGLEDEELGLEDEELEGDVGGGGREVSVDDFLAALEIALEDVMGEEVEVSQDEEELEDEEMDLDLEGDELDLEAEEDELELQERRGRGMEALVGRITRRVAERLVREKLSRRR